MRHGDPRSSTIAQSALLFLLAAVACFAGSRLGYAFTIRPGGVVALWPPAGVTLALLLLLPKRKWPLLVLGTFAGSVAWDLSSLSLPFALLAGFANGVESLLAAWVLLQ